MILIHQHLNIGIDRNALLAEIVCTHHGTSVSRRHAVSCSRPHTRGNWRVPMPIITVLIVWVFSFHSIMNTTQQTQMNPSMMSRYMETSWLSTSSWSSSVYGNHIIASSQCDATTVNWWRHDSKIINMRTFSRDWTKRQHWDLFKVPRTWTLTSKCVIV